MIILHSELFLTFCILCRNLIILTKSLSCLPRMVNTRANPASQEQAEGSEVRDANLPHPPSLAEVMMEAERNKRETNRLLERIEQNTAHHQRANVVSLSDFIKLHPPTFHHSVEPLDADDWLRSISHKLRSALVAEADKVTFAAYHLEGPASLWWENYGAMRPAGHVTTWAEFSEAFREHHIPEGLMDRKREECCSFTQGRLSVDVYSDMQLRKCLPMPRSKQGSVRALVLSFAVTFVCMSAHLFRNLSTKPSVLKLVRLTMTQHASMAVTWVPHPVLVLRSAACGCPTPPCHPGSHRGHLSRRLALFNSLHQPSPMGVQPTMLLHVPVP